MDTGKISATEDEALQFHAERAARQTVDRAAQAAGDAARPVARLFAGRRRSVPAHPARPGAAYDYTAKGNFVAVISNGTAVLGPRRSRRAGGQAGDGRQGGAVQALCRYRLHRPRDRHQGRRRVRQLRALPASRVRRHQPRGHQGAGMLRDRAAAARADGHPGVPRRPARHRDHRRRRADQRAASDRARTARHQDGGQRRRRGGDRLRRAAEGDGHAGRQRHAVRHQAASSIAAAPRA